VLVEALAMGLPIIAIFASGVKDILTSGYDSILVSEDEKQFTDAIVQVSTNSSLYAYLAENACITAQKYNVAETSAKLLEVYESVIAEAQ
jgi:glycosyltransferase involved in cell wall biosynthesis